MPKKIISLALSEEAIQNIDNKSKALGMSRSEYIDIMAKKGFHFDDEEQEEVVNLQEKIKKIIGGK